MRQETAKVIQNRIQYEKDAVIKPEEIDDLRLTVGWPPLGIYQQILDEGLFHISARLDGQLVGFVHVTGSPHGDLLIHDFCIRPDVQGKGVGTCLMEMALEACRALRPQGVNVLFEEKNRAFFEQFGFRILYGGYMNARALFGKSRAIEKIKEGG